MIDLLESQQRYPTALYSYFRLTKVADTYNLFMQDTKKVPEFSYIAALNEQTIQERLASLRQDLAAAQNAATSQFLTRRIQEKEILALFHAMHQDVSTVSHEDIERYIAAQVALYGPVDTTLFNAILAKLGFTTGSVRSKLYEPDAKSFKYYRELFSQTMPHLLQVLDAIPSQQDYDSQTIRLTLESALQAVGADKWSVRLTRHGSNLITSKHRQQIVLSEHWRPASQLRLRQVVAHEVGGHVQRALHNVSDMLRDEEEGLAIMLEQLVAKRFMHKRAMRYLALGFALGLDGKQRDFCETYSIMVDAMQRLGKTEDNAKRSAFYETVRVFRGGFPGIPGAVYIKDKVYLESNLRVWQKLGQASLEQADFAHLFVGDRDTMLQQGGADV